jgi:hypothetical protein
MPCPVSLGGLNVNNELRYPFMCGAMANEYGAQVVTKIDRRITDRHIFIAGGGVDPEASWRCQRAAVSKPRAGGKSAGWVSAHSSDLSDHDRAVPSTGVCDESPAAMPVAL